MIRKTRLAGAFAFGAGLTAVGVAFAQTQTGSAPPPAQATPAPAQSTPPWVQSGTPAIKPWDASQPVYSVAPPPEGSSGIYLPAVVGGYAKSVAGCVLIGCDDGPQVGGAPGPSSKPDEPPPQPQVNPGPSDPH